MLSDQFFTTGSASKPPEGLVKCRFLCSAQGSDSLPMMLEQHTNTEETAVVFRVIALTEAEQAQPEPPHPTAITPSSENIVAIHVKIHEYFCRC